jgi:N-acetylornithine carbamoyltransferase
MENAHVVYPKAWCPVTLFKQPVGEDDPEKAQKIFDQYKDWKCTSEIMDIADKNAIYMHCLPADRGYEVTNDVIDKTEGTGWTSAAFIEAENRLHVQKAVMSMVMS